MRSTQADRECEKADQGVGRGPGGPPHLFGSLLLFLIALAGRAEIIDRIAVSVGNQVITSSDLEIEIRVTAFLDGVKPDLSPTGKRKMAERMVEQYLIRRELKTSRYPEPPESEIAPVLEEFKQRTLPTAEAYRQALQEYGISEKDVTSVLLWQRTMLAFVKLRFRPSVQVSDQDIGDYFAKVVQPAAQAATPGQPVALEDYRAQIEEKLTGERANQEMDAWLRGARRRTEIVFHEEVFR